MCELLILFYDFFFQLYIPAPYGRVDVHAGRRRISMLTPRTRRAGWIILLS